MSSFKNMAIADAMVKNENIAIRKSMFGLGRTIVYKPTGSVVEAMVKDYSPEQGAKFEELADLPIDKIADEVKSKGKPKSFGMGNVRAEICLARDHKFAAVQFFRFKDFKFMPESDIKFFVEEGADAFSCLL